MASRFVRVTAKLKLDEKVRQKLEKALKRASGSYATMGVHDDAGHYDGTDVTPGQVAAWQEFGTKRMVARPFLRPSIDDNLPAIQALQAKQLARLMTDKVTVQKALITFAEFIKNLVQAKILSNVGPSLRPYTLKLKAARNQTPNSLYATGLMYRSVGYKVHLSGGAAAEAKSAEHEAAPPTESSPLTRDPMADKARRAEQRKAGKGAYGKYKQAYREKQRSKAPPE